MSEALRGPLPIAEFGFPGEQRDRLVAAILAGEKTATTGLLVECELDCEPIPRAGERFLVVDSSEAPVAIIEVEDVRVLRLTDVDIAVAHDEGEGLTPSPSGVARTRRSGTATRTSCALGSTILRGDSWTRRPWLSSAFA